MTVNDKNIITQTSSGGTAQPDRTKMERSAPAAMGKNNCRRMGNYNCRWTGKRRKRKQIEFNLVGSTWTPVAETWYIYDGMTVIQERSNSNIPTVHYTRGLDLSGSLGGAGGISGLLTRSSGYNASTGAWSTHDYYHADGSGNITLLISNSTTPTIRAQYEYDPFGRIQTQSGILATANTQRFSSKEQIGSSPLSYYGFRFCHAETQRWINRDPFGSVTSQMNAEMFGTDAAAFYEEGIFDPELLPEGPNIYGYVGNNPINVVDPSGEVAPIVAVAAVAAVSGGFIAYRAYRSYRAAADRAGQSMIACSRSAAQRIATQAGKVARPVRHAPHGPRPDYRPHYHPGGNTPPHTHIWW